MADRFSATTIICDDDNTFIKAAIVGGHEVTIMNVIGISNPFFDLVRDPYPDHNTYIIGEHATITRGLADTIHPIVAMIRVWRHVFTSTLGIDPTQCNLIITEPVLNDHEQRRRMVEIMFDYFDFKSVLVAAAPVLAFYNRFGNGANASGIVVEIGDRMTQIVPIYAGLGMDRAAVKINYLGGRDITDKLAVLLSNQSVQLTQPTMRSFVTQIKENYCHVANPFDLVTIDTCPHRSLRHPVFLGNEKFQCVELLFNPQELRAPHVNQGNGLIALIISAINATSDPRLCRKILLSSGSSSFPGMTIRIQNALVDCGFDSREVHQLAGARTPLLGGCWLANNVNFNGLFTTKEEWDEEGYRLVEFRKI